MSSFDNPALGAPARAAWGGPDHHKPMADVSIPTAAPQESCAAAQRPERCCSSSRPSRRKSPMKPYIVTQTTLLATAIELLLGLVVLGATPQVAEDPDTRRERARQLLAESLCGADPVLIQARAKAAARMFAEAGDPLGEGLSLLAVGSTEVIEGDFAAGEDAFAQALRIVTASADLVGLALVRMVEAAAWRTAQQYEKAELSLRQAIEALRRLERDDGELPFESLRYFAPQQFTPEALNRMAPILELLKPVLAQNLQSIALVDLARVQRQQGLHRDALQTLEQAERVTEIHMNGLDPILAEKAEIEAALDRPARALELYEAALPLAQQRGDIAGQARILRGLADVHENGGRPERAVEHRERAEMLAPSGDSEP